MADVKLQFTVKQGTARSLFNAIKAAIGRTARNNFSDLRPLVQEAIDKAVEDNKNKLIPTDSEAVELGVGDGGSIDTNKTRGAWRALKPSEERITTFSVRKRGTERSQLIGEVRINIDEEAFFNAPNSIVETPDSDAIDEIPWMEWFIKGKTIQGDSFSSQVPRDTLSRLSRTGGGIMIFGGMWSFTGKGRVVFDAILNDARLEINRQLKSQAGARILRRLR